MAQNSYIGVSGKARTIKAINVGVAGKARKVVNGYIGVAGKARPFFSLAKGIKFYQTVDPLNAAASYLAAASIGDYGLFAGGSTTSTQVTSYNRSLQKGTPTALSASKRHHSGQSNSGYALFAGGVAASGNGTVYDTVEGYSSSLQKSSATLRSPRYSMASAYIRSGYSDAVFAGGCLSDGGGSTTVDSYNSVMQRINLPDLETAVSNFAGGEVGNYIIFAGGRPSGGGVSTQVVAYNKSLQKSIPTPLSVGRALLAAANITNTTDANKKYILFAGGNDGFSETTLIEGYNASLQQTILGTGLETAQAGLVGTSCRGYEGETAVYQAVFAGDLLNTVTIINSSLQRLTPSAISSSLRPGLAATWVPYSTREYALLGGGNNMAVVDAFTYF